MFNLKENKKIYVVTNRKLIDKDSNLCKVIEKCALKGADGVILREKDLEYKDLKHLGESIKIITDKYKIPLIINGNINAVLDVNAYGFHTGFQNFKSIRGNENICENLVVGVSVHKVEEAVEAEKLGANYLIAGHIFETDCKLGLKGRGIEFLEEICEKVTIPVIAIGGIKENNIKKVLNTKVYGVAIMSSAMKIR
ncbi:thiamine phosphate synthase [Clostridium sp. P21]|uniref:Thiamine phosphate synthase n=1 Tax=Clostridium muellerianum TaxID=2716538 RepID=A0A7Y0HMN0_9CLOT|nr:thiamine phosphate synthase [Clostridium muellerianum]NMM62340.1 thiamine phosphate synthase [Clostridium muellerianum]